MARALRVAVPLKAMCSSRWEMPIWPGVSLRLPVLTQMPRAALSSWLMGSLTTVKPLESLDISRVMAPRCSGSQSRRDELAKQRQVVGQDVQLFGQVHDLLQTVRHAGIAADGAGHRIGELGRMGGGENDRGRGRRLDAARGM